MGDVFFLSYSMKTWETKATLIGIEIIKNNFNNMKADGKILSNNNNKMELDNNTTLLDNNHTTVPNSNRQMKALHIKQKKEEIIH